MKYYAGIGARKTPPEILKVMTQIAAFLENDGYTLRSGGARGADSAFSNGVKDLSKMEIYTTQSTDVDWVNAMHTVDQLHPAPHALGPYTKRLMSRNAFQIGGAYINKFSDFVVCWTPDAAETSTSKASGGTGQAIRIANYYKIPVINLANPKSLEKVMKLMEI